MKVEPNLSGGANASLATYFSARRIRTLGRALFKSQLVGIGLEPGWSPTSRAYLTRPPPMAVRNYGASALSSIRPRTFCRANCVQGLCKGFDATSPYRLYHRLADRRGDVFAALSGRHGYVSGAFESRSLARTSRAYVDLIALTLFIHCQESTGVQTFSEAEPTANDVGLASVIRTEVECAFPQG